MYFRELALFVAMASSQTSAGSFASDYPATLPRGGLVWAERRAGQASGGNPAGFEQDGPFLDCAWTNTKWWDQVGDDSMDHPRRGIDAFLDVVKLEAVVLHAGYQTFARKTGVNPLHGIPCVQFEPLVVAKAL